MAHNIIMQVIEHCSPHNVPLRSRPKCIEQFSRIQEAFQRLEKSFAKVKAGQKEIENKEEDSDNEETEQGEAREEDFDQNDDNENEDVKIIDSDDKREMKMIDSDSGGEEENERNIEIRSGVNEFEDVNTVVDDEDVGITHSDDEKEVKMPNSDNGDESNLDSTNSYSGSVVKRDLPKLRFSLLPSKISKYSKNNRPLPFLKTSPIILSLPQTIFVSISSTSIKEKPDSAKAELDNSPNNQTRWKPSTKSKVAMCVDYVGTNYRGLQIQRDFSSTITIEDELENAILKTGGMLESNYGNLHKNRSKRSSRTDKGVHSLAIVITMKMEIPNRAWEKYPDGRALANVINGHLSIQHKDFQHSSGE